jgi:hypothetical protein
MNLRLFRKERQLWKEEALPLILDVNDAPLPADPWGTRVSSVSSSSIPIFYMLAEK